MKRMFNDSLIKTGAIFLAGASLYILLAPRFLKSPPFIDKSGALEIPNFGFGQQVESEEPVQASLAALNTEAVYNINPNPTISIK